MDESDRRLLMRAAELHRPLRRAAALARANGWGYLIFGLLTLLLALPGLDLAGLFLGAALVAAGTLEARGARCLARGEASAARRLSRSELGLMAVILTYAALRLLLRPDAEEIQAQLDQTSALGLDLDDWIASADTLVSLVLAVVALVYQGSLGRYFHRLGPHIAAYHEAAPEWARRLVEELSR